MRLFDDSFIEGEFRMRGSSTPQQENEARHPPNAARYDTDETLKRRRGYNRVLGSIQSAHHISQRVNASAGTKQATSCYEITIVQ
jgi:hypothetical protein